MGAAGTSGPSGEDRLIADYFRPLARTPGALGLHDDAAFFSPPPGCDLVLTKDAIVAGVHFFADDAAADIARKALRVNLSDLAAKGADPAGFLLAIALTADLGAAWLRDFSQALGADAEHYGCPLFGGDTVRTPGALTISITAFGTLPAGRMVHRRGAKVGDAVCVTGMIGDAALGLMVRRDGGQGARWALTDDQRRHLLRRYLAPEPRCRLAAAVREHASAAMDVSDGLVGDFGKLCAESSVSAEIDVTKIPLSAAVRAAIAADGTALDAALTGGDDYEVLCTVPEARLAAFRAAAASAGESVTQIGRIVDGTAAPRFMRDGRPMMFGRGSFSHF